MINVFEIGDIKTSSAGTFSELHDEFDRNLAELREIIKVLGQDCKDHLAAIQKSDNQIHRRAYVRSVFAFIEGLMYRTKLIAAHIGSAMKTLSLEEIQAIKEVSFDINDKGEVIPKAVFSRFLNNVKFTFKVFSKSFGSPFMLSISGKGWQSLKEATKVRDRLMHPKQISDLEVRDEEVKATESAYNWFLLNHTLCGCYAQKVTQAKRPTVPEDFASLDPDIPKLETMLKKKGG